MPKITYYELVTTGGRSLLPASAKVYTHIGNNNYLEKNVQQLRQGESVLWLNEHIDTTLEEIEPYLISQSPRYREAETALFLINKHGRRIPVLRAELIRGLKNKVNIDGQEDLEQKILKEGDDFTSSQYTSMRSYLYEQLVKISERTGIPSRSEDAIDEWLKGETVAPANWNLFYALARITGNSTFDEIYNPKKQPPSFRDHYRLYVTTRRGIMNWLSRRTPKQMYDLAQKESGREAQEDKSQYDGIELTLERRIVMNQFFRQINREFSDARVLSVESYTTDARQQKKGEERSTRLHKGVYAKRAVPNEIVVTDINQLISYHGLYIHLLELAVHNYFLKAKLIGKWPWKRTVFEELSEKFEQHNVYEKEFKAGIMMFLFDKTLDFGPFKGVIKAQDKFPEMRDWFLWMADQFYSAMLNGAVDKTLKLPEGATYSLYESTTNVMRAVPDVMYEINGPQALGRKSRRERRDLEKSLKRVYGYQPGKSKTLLSDGVESEAVLDILSQSGFEVDYFSLEEIMDRLPRLLESPELSTKLEMVKNMFYTKPEVQTALAKFNLESLMKIIHPNNFIFDTNQLN